MFRNKSFVKTNNAKEGKIGTINPKLRKLEIDIID